MTGTRGESGVKAYSLDDRVVGLTTMYLHFICVCFVNLEQWLAVYFSCLNEFTLTIKFLYLYFLFRKDNVILSSCFRIE